MQAPAGTWPLLVDADGWYTEAPGANIIVVRRGQVGYCDEAALPGISMQTVATLTNATSSAFLRNQEVDELWLTGTPFCMLPVVSLDGRPIGTGTPGPVFQQTLAKWSELVGVNIQQQIAGWDRT